MDSIITRIEARRLGLKIYFDGEQCNREHISEKFTISGRCCDCASEDNEVIKEQKQDSVDRTVQHKEKAKESLAYIRQTLSELSESEKLGLLTNYTTGSEDLDVLPRTREIAEALDEEFYDTRLPCKRNHLSKRESATGVCIACKQFLREEYKPYAKVYAHERRARFRSAEGFFNKSDIDLLYLGQSGLCLYCEAELSLCGYHVDHRVPLAKGGTNWPENLQLLCPTCNLKKKDKLPEQFEKEIGYVRNE